MEGENGGVHSIFDSITTTPYSFGMIGGPRSTIGWLECRELRSNLSREGDVSDVEVVDDVERHM